MASVPQPEFGGGESGEGGSEPESTECRAAPEKTDDDDDEEEEEEEEGDPYCCAIGEGRLPLALASDPRDPMLPPQDTLRLIALLVFSYTCSYREER